MKHAIHDCSFDIHITLHVRFSSEHASCLLYNSRLALDFLQQCRMHLCRKMSFYSILIYVFGLHLQKEMNGKGASMEMRVHVTQN